MKLEKKRQDKKQGSGCRMGGLNRLRTRLAMPALLGVGVLIFSAGFTSASAGAKKLSDKAVAYLMNLTWAIMPAKIKSKDGKEITIDRKNRKQTEIPPDEARKVIMAARLSAHAQICKLPKLQKANYRTLMHKELSSGKWSRKQIVYINQLHLFTVMWLTGNVTISEEGAKKKKDAKKLPTCSPEQRKKVKAQIEAYLKANPLPKKTAAKNTK